MGSYLQLVWEILKDSFWRVDQVLIDFEVLGAPETTQIREIIWEEDEKIKTVLIKLRLFSDFLSFQKTLETRVYLTSLFLKHSPLSFYFRVKVYNCTIERNLRTLKAERKWCKSQVNILFYIYSCYGVRLYPIKISHKAFWSSSWEINIVPLIKRQRLLITMHLYGLLLFKN